MPTRAPYGSWRSPITPQSLVEAVVGLSQLVVDGDDIYWNESRPTEGGRLVVVRRAPDGSTSDVIPSGFSARTRVHEYGGLSYCVRDGVVWFANFADQRLYRADTMVPITPEPASPAALRFADFTLTPDGTQLIAVRETHADEVVNDLAVVAADGGREPRTVVEGHDFFAAPRLSPDGTRLAWLSWDHPNMPWDGTELWVAELGPGLVLGSPRLVAGGRAESVTQPRWSPDGALHFLSDRSGWWNLYADGGPDAPPRALLTRESEFGGPDWGLGQSTYCFLRDGRIASTWSERGRRRIGLIAEDGVTEVDVPFSSLTSVVAAPDGNSILAVAGSHRAPTAIVRIALPSGEVEVLKRTRDVAPDKGYLSEPEPIEFPTAAGKSAHAWFYAPRNTDFEAEADEKPPLIVMSHGGPTGSASPELDLGKQYWTSRGFAVVDVDYGGSTGYGREYRERLRGTWGVVDVEDCVNAALWLAQQGRVDADRMVIRGGSAGGYTTLAALTFEDVFAAGASHFGVADVGALARDTHKFESRYLDGLIGPWPEAEAIYDARSPINHTDQLSCPLILFQGLEDRIVPPEQSELMASALRAKQIPVAYLAFEGEQHGFRRAENIVRVAEAELSFYAQVLGFVPAGDIEPVAIEFAENLKRG